MLRPYRQLPAITLLIAATIATASSAQQSPRAPEQSEPASQAVATDAPLLPPAPDAPSVQTPAQLSPAWPWQRRSAFDNPAPKPAQEEVWYGWQTLLTDAASLPALVYPPLGIGTYALGGPIVHWAHGNTGKGFASLGLRVGTPLLIGFASSLGCDDPEEPGDWGWECNVRFALGGLVGVLTAITVDAAVLGYETVPVEREAALTVGPLKLMPSVSSNGKHTTISLGGTF